MSADDGGLKSGSRASQPAEPGSEREGADDLDALASGLGSISPGADHDDGGDDDGNLAKLAALSARTTKESLANEDARVSLDGAEKPAAAAPATNAPPPAATKITAAEPANAAPAAPAPARASWVVPLIVGLGLGVGIAGVVFGMSARREPDAAPQSAPAVMQVQPASSMANEPAAAAPAAEPVAAAPAASRSAAAPVAPVNPPPAAVAAPAPAAQLAPAAARVRNAEDDESASAAAGPTPESRSAAVLSVRPAETPEAPAAEAEAGEEEQARPAPTAMDTLLDEALSPEARRQEIEEKKRIALQEQTIPLTPSREDVTQALTVLLPAIRGCAMGHTGNAIAAIVVHADGRVASAEIAGAPFAGTASGRCMEGVIRRARFPRFSQAAFRVRFPLAIQ